MRLKTFSTISMLIKKNHYTCGLAPHKPILLLSILLLTENDRIDLENIKIDLYLRETWSELFSFENPLLEDWRIGLLNLNGRHEEAIIQAEKRLKEYPNNTNHLTQLYEKAFAFYKLGKIEEAVTTLKKSIQGKYSDKRKANSLYFLGYIYATELDNYEESLHFINNAIELNDSDPTIKKTKEIIEKIIKNKDKEKIGKKDYQNMNTSSGIRNTKKIGVKKYDL